MELDGAYVWVTSRKLKPGSRIVSHDFPIGDWAPERVVQFKGPERTHALSLWTIPSR